MDSSLINDDNILLEEIERMKQELHSAHQNIEILTKNVQHLEEENTDLKNDLEEQTHRQQGSRKGEQKKSDGIYRQQIVDLQITLEETQASERLCKQEIANMQKKLKDFLDSATCSACIKSNNDSVDETNNNEVINGLIIKVNNLEQEKKSLKDKLSSVALELQSMTDMLTILRQELKEKDEEIECLETHSETQSNIIEHLRDENNELKSRIEIDEAQVGVQRKGNSLFSEVDDRRVMAETKIVKMETLLKNVEEQLTKEQKENKRLKQQILALRQMTTSGYNENRVKALLAEVAESKKQIIQLTESLQRMAATQPQATRELKFPATDNMTDSDKNYIKYLQDIVRDKEKEVSAQLQAAQQSDLQLRRTELHLAEAKKEIITLEHKKDILMSQNAHLNILVQELRRKYETDSCQMSAVQGPMISIHDGSKVLSISNDSSNNIQTSKTIPAQTGSEETTKENDSKVVGQKKRSSRLKDRQDPEIDTRVNSRSKNITYQEVEVGEVSECKHQ